MTVLEKARKLRARIKDFSEKIKQSAIKLDKLERECNHEWGGIKYTPHKRWYEDKDHCPEGMWETQKMWTRICKKCEAKQNTEYEPRDGKWVSQHRGVERGCACDFCKDYPINKDSITLVFNRDLAN